MFFATPHQGGNHEKLGDIAAKVAKGFLRNEDNSFMEALKKDSLFGEELVKTFRHQIEDFYVVSFFETHPYKRMGLVRFMILDVYLKADSLRLSIRSPLRWVYLGNARSK
jgi:hypothetical protein